MAIFKTSGQAIHFSYVIQAYDASPQSQMASIMRNAIKQLGARSSSIDFGGLNPLEVRGQCAMIRACVRDHLRSNEADVLEAKYSRVPDTKGRAMEALARQYAPLVGGDTSLTLAILWRDRVDTPLKRSSSLRAIAKEYSVSKSDIHRKALILRDHLDLIEGAALSNLHQRFVEDEVIEP